MESYSRGTDARSFPPESPAECCGTPPPSTAALREGIDKGEIFVRYQPIVRLADRRPVMVEALARWHPAPAAVSPEVFVAMAERAGLALALSEQVATRAAGELERLRPRLRLGVAINLPLALLLQPELPRWLGRVFAGSGLGPERVTLELTETTVVRDLSALRRALIRLRRAGYGVLLDDLHPEDGRGRLAALPFAGIKLDRSLVEALPEDGRARQAVRRLVAGARGRGQRVIGEGVASRRLWACLRSLGVDHAQGFGVGQPLPAEALPAWSRAWRGGERPSDARRRGMAPTSVP